MLAFNFELKFQFQAFLPLFVHFNAPKNPRKSLTDNDSLAPMPVEYPEPMANFFSHFRVDIFPVIECWFSISHFIMWRHDSSPLHSLQLELICSVQLVQSVADVFEFDDQPQRVGPACYSGPDFRFGSGAGLLRLRHSNCHTPFKTGPRLMAQIIPRRLKTTHFLALVYIPEAFVTSVHSLHE